MKHLLRLLLILPWISICGFSMVYDGIHETSDYEAIANQDSIFQTAAFIYSDTGSLSGVLIAPDIVATAAHGVVQHLKSNKNIKNRGGLISISAEGLNVYFPNAGVFEASEFYIDVRYLENFALEQNKYDFAYIRLKKPVQTIRPAQIQDDIQFDLNGPPLVVISYGNSDRELKSKPNLFSWFFSKPREFHKPRGFYLYEISEFYVGDAIFESKDHFASTSFSSLFFNPRAKTRGVSLDDEPYLQRKQAALKKWKTDQKPVALALPGTSGAPVFMQTKNNQYILIGLITSFSRADGVLNGPLNWQNLVLNPQSAFNRYQTNFSLFYRKSFLHKSATILDLKRDQLLKQVKAL